MLLTYGDSNTNSIYIFYRYIHFYLLVSHRLENLKTHHKIGWTDNNESYASDGIRRRVRCCIQLDQRIRLLV